MPIKTRCGDCGRETDHSILEDHGCSGYNEDAGIQWESKYQIVKCLGCGEISFRHVYDSSEEMQETEERYPDPYAKKPMDEYSSFPRKTRWIYKETLKALSNDMPILAAIGLRALIESICKHQKTTGSNLGKRIDQLVDMGHLTKTQADFLHQHRFMGNEAAHEIEAPESDALDAALDIAETLLKTIYVLPKKADKMKSGRVSTTKTKGR
jgi:hypothetical protein